jgi:acyl carrier protein
MAGSPTARATKPFGWWHKAKREIETAVAVREVADCAGQWFPHIFVSEGHLASLTNDCLNSKRDSVVDKNRIQVAVRTYIIDNFLLGASDELDDSTELMEAGILDSTGVMELVAFLETTFEVAIAEEEIIPENLNSINHICSFIARKVS